MDNHPFWQDASKTNKPGGLLVVIEGIDGSGKTTLAHAAVQRLIEKGISAVSSFEPTKGPYGCAIRKQLEKSKIFSPDEEADLFLKDRHEHVFNFILPTLKKGAILILDRYVDSMLAYQGARGVDVIQMEAANWEFAPKPDVAFLLDLDVSAALDRIIQKRGSTLTSFESADYLEEVRKRFLDRWENPHYNACWVILDAARPLDELILEVVDKIIQHRR